jgi:hypothetical protein
MDHRKCSKKRQGISNLLPSRFWGQAPLGFYALAVALAEKGHATAAIALYDWGVRFFEFPDSRANTLFAGTHARGGANSFLWISEWGYVQSEDVRPSGEPLRIVSASTTPG